MLWERTQSTGWCLAPTGFSPSGLPWGSFPALFSIVASCEGKGDLLSISDLGYHEDTEIIAAKARNNGWKVSMAGSPPLARGGDQKRLRRRWKPSISIPPFAVPGSLPSISRRSNPVAAEVARVVCDYDLWIHADPRSAVLGQVLQRKKNREHVRDCLISGIFTDDLIEREYAEIKAEMDAMMHRSLAHATILGQEIPDRLCSPLRYPSETAHFIRNEKKTDIEVIIGKDGKFSVRSVPPISHLLAREFGGGGHPNAAGASFNFTVIERFTWWLFKKSRHFDTFVKVAEMH